MSGTHCATTGDSPGYGEKVMKEWIVIQHAALEDYQKDLELFQESIAFASSKA